jgi:hypothetical protein
MISDDLIFAWGFVCGGLIAVGLDLLTISVLFFVRERRRRRAKPYRCPVCKARRDAEYADN